TLFGRPWPNNRYAYLFSAALKGGDWSFVAEIKWFCPCCYMLKHYMLCPFVIANKWFCMQHRCKLTNHICGVYQYVNGGK
ncbi:MAG: hypothetical protein D6B27_06775, partial [Gammaproteobacteria bacterium]